MKNYTQDPDAPRETSALLQRYVAKEVIGRLALIDTLYEQEIVQADYFMYVQDYAPAWIPLLRVGQAQPFLGGEKLNLQLGTESAPIQLEVYTRWGGRTVENLSCPGRGSSLRAAHLQCRRDYASQSMVC